MSVKMMMKLMMTKIVSRVWWLPLSWCITLIKKTKEEKKVATTISTVWVTMMSTPISRVMITTIVSVKTEDVGITENQHYQHC